MNSSDHLAARHIGGYTPSLIEERWTGPLHGRSIPTLHLAEKGIPRFRMAHLGSVATDGNVACGKPAGIIVPICAESKTMCRVFCGDADHDPPSPTAEREIQYYASGSARATRTPLRPSGSLVSYFSLLSIITPLSTSHSAPRIDSDRPVVADRWLQLS